MFAFAEPHNSDQEDSIPLDIIDSLAAVVTSKPSRDDKSTRPHPSCLEKLSQTQDGEEKPILRNRKKHVNRKQMDSLVVTEIAAKKQSFKKQNGLTFKQNQRRQRIRTSKPKTHPCMDENIDSVLTMFVSEDSTSPPSQSISPTLTLAYAMAGRHIPRRKGIHQRVKDGEVGRVNLSRFVVRSRKDIHRSLKVDKSSSKISTESLLLLGHDSIDTNNSQAKPGDLCTVTKKSDGCSMPSLEMKLQSQSPQNNCTDNFDLVAKLDNLKLTDGQNATTNTPSPPFCQIHISKTDQTGSEISPLASSPLHLMPIVGNTHTPMASNFQDDGISAAFSALSVSMQQPTPFLSRLLPILKVQTLSSPVNVSDECFHRDEFQAKLKSSPESTSSSRNMILQEQPNADSLCMADQNLETSASNEVQTKRTQSFSHLPHGDYIVNHKGSVLQDVQIIDDWKTPTSSKTTTGTPSTHFDSLSEARHESPIEMSSTTVKSMNEQIPPELLVEEPSMSQKQIKTELPIEEHEPSIPIEKPSISHQLQCSSVVNFTDFVHSSPSMTSMTSHNSIQTSGSKRITVESSTPKFHHKQVLDKKLIGFSPKVSITSCSSVQTSESKTFSIESSKTPKFQQNNVLDRKLADCSPHSRKSILWSVEPNSLKRNNNVGQHGAKLNAFHSEDAWVSVVGHGKRSILSPGLSLNQKRIDNKQTPGKNVHNDCGNVKINSGIPTKAELQDVDSDKCERIVRRSRRQRAETNRFTFSAHSVGGRYLPDDGPDEKVPASLSTHREEISSIYGENNNVKRTEHSKIAGSINIQSSVSALGRNTEQRQVRRSQRERKQTDFLLIGSDHFSSHQSNGMPSKENRERDNSYTSTVNLDDKSSNENDERKRENDFHNQGTRKANIFSDEAYPCCSSAKEESTKFDDDPNETKMTKMVPFYEKQSSSSESEDEFIQALNQPEKHVSVQTKAPSFQGKRPVRRLPVCSRICLQPLDKMKFNATSVDGSLWSLPQFDQLRLAHAAVDPGSSCFWIDVASQVDGKTPAECRNYWFSLVKTPKVTKNAKKLNDCDRVNSYHYDIFDSTPMRSMLPENDRSFAPAIEGLDFGGELEVDYDSAYFKAFENAGIGVFEKISGSNFKFEHGHQAYLQKIKRDVSQVRKNERKKSLRSKCMDRGAKVLVTGVHNADIDMSARLSPGGTLKVRSHCDDDFEDDLWCAMYDAEDEDHE